MHDKKIYLSKYKEILKVSIFILCPFLLILMQPDAGSALIYASLVIMFFREGLKIEYILFIGLCFILSALTIIASIKYTMIFLIIINFVFAYFLKKKNINFMPALISFIIGALLILGINYSYENILQPHQKERIDIIIGKEKNS